MNIGLFFNLAFLVNFLFISIGGESYRIFYRKNRLEVISLYFLVVCSFFISATMTFFLRHFLLGPAGLSSFGGLLYMIIYLGLIFGLSHLFKSPTTNDYTDFNIVLVTINSLFFVMLFLEEHLLSTIGLILVYSLEIFVSIVLATIISSSLDEKLAFEKIPKAWRGIPVLLLIAAIASLALSPLNYL